MGRLSVICRRDSEALFAGFPDAFCSECLQKGEMELEEVNKEGSKNEKEGKEIKFEPALRFWSLGSHAVLTELNEVQICL